MTGRRGSTKRTERGGRAFDAFDLVLLQATIAGTADVASMPRVMDRLAVDETAGGGAKVSWRITGATDGLGRPALEIELRGSVPLECQRCLQAFAWSVAQDTTLLLARNERELAALDESDDTHEVVLAAAPLDAPTLIEDEVLLALPFAPRCEQPECQERVLSAQGPGTPRTSAFAALAGLKKDAGKAKS
jgi:uncharacterized protein